jgi:hypothetical protein
MGRLDGGTWESPRTIPRRVLVGVFAGCAIFGLLVAIVSTNDIHRFWGTAAACGYAAAAIAAFAWRSDRGVDLAVGISLVGALLVPLAWLAVTNQQQPEVSVIAYSAWLLIHHGTPYRSVAALAHTSNSNLYNPYLPVMSVFGLLDAAFGHNAITDPRVWFGLCFLVVFWLAMRRGGARDPFWWTLFVAGSPVIAFQLTVGGDDVPMVAFLCLGYAFLWSEQNWQAALALGIGAAMKATAWPAVVIAFVYVVATQGWRKAWQFAGVVVAVLVVCVGPFLATHGKTLVINTIEFPLGLAHITSAASSPLPGHLIADTGHLGHSIVVGLLIATVLGIGVSLLIRPPRTVESATIRLVVALTLMFVIAPSTRFGYFIYPAALLIWMLVCRNCRIIRQLPGEAPTPLASADKV